MSSEVGQPVVTLGPKSLRKSRRPGTEGGASDSHVGTPLTPDGLAIGLGLYANLGTLDDPVLRSCETAIRSCAGAKGFLSKMLFGTPCIDHSSGFPPVI